MGSSSAVSRELVIEQLDRVLASSLFQGAVRSRALLTFIVEETLNSRIDRLKEYTIGAEALDRGDSFDPRTDPIVRAEASRLRGRLERYFASEGREDPIIIVLPKGSYVPQFQDQRRVLASNADLAPPLVRTTSESRNLLWIASIAMVALCAFLIGWLVPRSLKHVPEPQMIQFDAELKSLGSLGSEVGADILMSPDGTRLVFVSRDASGVPHLNTRRLNEAEATQLPGTEGARVPFFSPDGEWVAFEAMGKLKKTPVGGGSPEIICDATNLLGGTWGEDGNIVASLGWGKLWRVPAVGGTAAIIVDLTGEHSVPEWPQALQNGKTILFTNVGYGGPNQATIEALSLATGKRTVVARGGTYGRYLADGFLTYVNQGTLFAVHFDLDRMQTSGNPTPVLNQVSYSSTFGFAQLDFSQTGTLVYRKDTGGQVTVELQDHKSEKEPLPIKPGHYVWPRVSLDGQRLAYGAVDGGVTGIRIYDRRTNHTIDLAAPAGEYLPLWTRDGRFLILGGPRGLLWIRSDGSGKAESLLQRGSLQSPWSMSPDGSRLAYHELNPATGFDIWTVPIHVSNTGVTAGKPEPFLQSPAFETYPSFSPDGRWIAYGSNASGSWEVYVRAFPDGQEAVQVSNAGGRIAFWSHNGRDLFYRTDAQQIMSARYVIRGDSFVVQGISPWSSSRLADTGVLANLDLTADEKFVMLVPAATPESQQTENHVTFMLNFPSEVRRRLAESGGSK